MIGTGSLIATGSFGTVTLTRTMSPTSLRPCAQSLPNETIARFSLSIHTTLHATTALGLRPVSWMLSALSVR